MRPVDPEPAASPRVFRLADQRVMPWKNGRGSTVEIAIHPPGATVQSGFDWRVSLAAMVEHGPFSAFPGMDRTLVLAEGAGVDLVSASGTIELAHRHAITHFPGELELEARLHDGPIRDLNVMVRRAAYAHEAGIVGVRGPTDLGMGHPLLAIALAGDLTVGGISLVPGEAAVADGPLAANGVGTLLVARLTPR